MSEQIFWYATRSAGVLAWFAAAISLLVGLLMSSRALGRKPTLPWLLDLHRFLGAMAMLFLATHMVTLWADSFVHFAWAELFIPGKATVNGLSDLSIAYGVIAGYLMAIVQLSSYIKNRMPKRAWHTLHLLSYGTLVLGLIHGIQVGSDADNRVLIIATCLMLTAVVFLTLFRVFRLLGDRKYRYVVEQELAAPADDDLVIAPLEYAPVVESDILVGSRGLPPDPAAGDFDYGDDPRWQV